MGYTPGDITTGVAMSRDAKKPRKTQESGRFLLRLPRSLHRDLKDEARREGMSLNTLCVTKLAKPLAGEAK
jgi:predicted HicB family RNase H-like nuclease